MGSKYCCLNTCQPEKSNKYGKNGAHENNYVFNDFIHKELEFIEFKLIFRRPQTSNQFSLDHSNLKDLLQTANLLVIELWFE